MHPGKGNSGNSKDSIWVAGSHRPDNDTLAGMQITLEHAALSPPLRKLYQSLLASRAGQPPPYFELSSFVDNVKVCLPVANRNLPIHLSSCYSKQMHA
ncbi:hypothetical protein WJX73_006507 [Symbiochloris irregularis]|uniref:Uncharacterized protein n=1 Tax=Symbiochloris irregularis TaxID=706552 RepID=A0AAW1PQT2_9CHLO